MVSAADSPPVILVPDANTAVGPLVIASWINWLLMGTLVVQLYHFQTHFSKDRVAVRLLVYFVVTLDVVQTVISTHLTWFYAIANWDRPAVFSETTPWSGPMTPLMAGLVSGTVQLFYAWRIWILSHTFGMRCVSIIVYLLACAQAGTAIVSSIVIEFDRTQERLLQLHPAFEFWLAGSFTVDIIITASMIYILYNAKERNPLARTESLLNKLIINAIRTGLITVIAAGIDLGLFVAFTSNNYHYVPAYILGKLYSISLLATLNGRKSVGLRTTIGTTTSSFAPFESAIMRLEVSRVTRRTTTTEILREPDEWSEGKEPCENSLTDVESARTYRKASDADADADELQGSFK
ncbi:hypothetical protein D9613_011345 [Agrocybe pediades]|uniref:DUF6534 domain-containing protein n=1 Tax=Agrocybe pediades TaxID=84607 RepID=A0A8H4QRC4_9AGAR|nr:hypothetical protein D9613_011345 [Agrocybe pediades]